MDVRKIMLHKHLPIRFYRFHQNDKRTKNKTLLFFSLLILGYAGVHIFIEVQSRYRYFIIPTFMIMQGYGVYLITQYMKKIPGVKSTLTKTLYFSVECFFYMINNFLSRLFTLQLKLIYSSLQRLLYIFMLCITCFFAILYKSSALQSPSTLPITG